MLMESCHRHFQGWGLKTMTSLRVFQIFKVPLSKGVGCWARLMRQTSRWATLRCWVMDFKMEWNCMSSWIQCAGPMVISTRSCKARHTSGIT